MGFTGGAIRVTLGEMPNAPQVSTEPVARAAAPRSPMYSRDPNRPIQDDEPSWAHVSGWAQLSGARHTVSCVLPCGQDASLLSELLPVLSDTLTECGYPWELLLIAGDPDPATRAVVAAWTELPGFRVVEPGRPMSGGDAYAIGLMAARGDAVILMDPRIPHPPELIPQMMLLWEDDALMVHARRDPQTRRSVLQHWTRAETQWRIARPGFVLPAECTELGLLDRQLIDWMSAVE